MPDNLIINPFDTEGYDMATMTEAVNLIPNNYGRVRQLNLFTIDSVRSRTVLVENINGTLTLLKSQPVGAPPVRKKHSKASMRPFYIPHFPHEDVIKAEDLQGGRQPGTLDPKTLQTEMTKSLTEMRANHAITEEFMLMTALKGEVLDGDGSTIYNYYTEFEITKKSITFALSTSTTDVAAKCRSVLRHIEDNLMGDVMSGVRCLCDETFFDALIGHDEVEKFYVNHAKAMELTGTGADPRKNFPFGGIVFEEYRAKATDPSGNARAFIEPGYAHFFPVGTMNTFKIHHAPANYLETVNTLGKPIYAKQTMESKGRWVDLNTESNPLPMCRRPGVLVTGLIN